MKKGCKPYKPNSKNSYTSTKSYLLAKGLIDKFLNIIDYNNFKKEVSQLTKLAEAKHGINEGSLFGERTISSADKSYYQAVPNKIAFNKIDGVKKKAQPKQELTDYYMGDQALREQTERELDEDLQGVLYDDAAAVKQKIKYDLPSEVADSITVLNEVPLDILGRDDLFLSLKDVLNDNGITDEVLINWAGVNKDKIGHPKSIKSDAQLTSIIRTILNKKQKEDQYIEFKVNPLALESFRKWIKALEKYSLPFQDAMLTHALKHITNPTRKSKYVLQLSEVALTKAHGIVVNKPHELNRIGKLYDQEVLATVSDSVDHEPSASGKGYWVHIPRSKGTSTGIKHHINIRDLTDQRNAPGKFLVEWMSEIDQEHEMEFFETRAEADAYALTLTGDTSTEEERKNYKKNVDLLRKLSPSTWCTASSMTEHYVQNYDNYLLIVDGVTVAGIEANPPSKHASKVKLDLKPISKEDYEAVIKNEGRGFFNEEFTEDGKTYYVDNGVRARYRRDDTGYYEEVEVPDVKIQVKEVTSRANNGMAPIDHLDDVIAFFEKHNLDLDNNSVKKAIRAKETGKVDKDYTGYEDDEFYYADYGYEEEDRGDVDDPGREYREEYERQDILFTISTFETLEEAINHFNINPTHINYFSHLPNDIRKNEELANKAINHDPHNITAIDTTLPFYNELVIKALTRQPGVFHYLPLEVRNRPDIEALYNREYKRLEEDLPFSKTNTNKIQGYYDAKNDKVVVIAANTPINEASKVGIHEVAHRGMLRMAKDLGGVQELGKALFAAEDQLMKKLPDLLRRTGHKSLESLMLDYGFTTTSNEGKIKLLMELAARWSETLVDKPKPAWWKELLRSIKAWIADFTGIVLDEKQVDELVGGFVKYGTNQATKTSSQNKDLFLYLSSELNNKLGFDNPGYNAGPTIQDLVNQMSMITKADIDNKKLDC